MPDNPPPTLAEQVAQVAQQVGAWAAFGALAVQNAWLAWQKARNPMGKAVERIEAQLTANGGSSVKDALTRLEAKIDALTQDVTLQRSMQRMLANMDDRFVTWVANPDGDFEFLSIGITELTGRQVESLKGSNWLMMVHDRDRERVECKWRDAVSHRRDIEVRFDIAGHDSVTPVVMRAYTSQTQTKTFTGWTGTITTQQGEDQ